MIRYAIDLVPEDDVLLVECPDLQGVHSFGDDEDDALRHGLDAVLTRLEMYMDDRQPIPPPRARRKNYVEIPPIAEAKIRLYEFMLERGLRKADLARMLGWKPMQVDRLFNLGHNSRIDQLQQAFAALGKELVMTLKVQDAA